MKGTLYKTKEAILKRAQEIKGIPLKDIDKKGRLKTGKGAIGTVIEESWFGYAPNSKSEPDFSEAGVELKVIPYIKHKDGVVSSKERLVCNIINYMEEFKKTFATSSFYHKCNTMLMMAYRYIANVPKGEFTIDGSILFSFPEEDLVIIEQDWKKIIEKIRAGKAHEITEGDTLYLAACTKGADRTSIRKQPFSPIPAKQRAWSLKTTYVTQILRKYIFGNEKDEKIIKDIKDIEHRSFEEYMIDMFRPYYGRSQNDLKREFGIASSAKSLNHLIIKKILGLQGDIEATEEFKKANITLKTIRVEEDGHIKESMSFPVIDFFELEKEDVWEESSLYDMLAPVKFMFVIFKMFNNEYVLDRVMFWNMPEQDLEEVKKVWQKTKEKAANGITFKEVNGKIKNDLPKSKENRVAHVRPHGRNRDDISLLPNGQTITKQCFWLNRSYIESIIGSKGKK